MSKIKQRILDEIENSSEPVEIEYEYTPQWNNKVQPITETKLLESPSVDNLERMINHLLSIGWELRGDIITKPTNNNTNHVILIQQMVKRG